MPSWVVAKANQYARDHALTPFVIYQGLWNVMDRSFEREIIPMARAEGMALAPWNVVAGGKLRSDEEEARRATTGEKGRLMLGDWRRNEEEIRMSNALEKVAKEVGAKHITSGTSFDFDSKHFESPILIEQIMTSCSCDCVPDAQDHFCVPTRWGQKGRAFGRQSRGSRHRADRRAHCIPREHRSFPSGLPGQYNCEDLI
jgi:hypothetical protein